jgi:hypothetical protein
LLYAGAQPAGVLFQNKESVGCREFGVLFALCWSSAGSSVISTLGLCFMSLGAYSMLIQANEDEVEFIGTVLVGISITCITSVILIMIFIDCGLWNRMFGRKKSTTYLVVSKDEVDGRRGEDSRE